MAQKNKHNYVNYVDMGDGWFVPEINAASLFEKELDKNGDIGYVYLKKKATGEMTDKIAIQLF